MHIIFEIVFYPFAIKGLKIQTHPRTSISTNVYQEFKNAFYELPEGTTHSFAFRWKRVRKRWGHFEISLEKGIKIDSPRAEIVEIHSRGDPLKGNFSSGKIFIRGREMSLKTLPFPWRRCRRRRWRNAKIYFLRATDRQCSDAFHSRRTSTTLNWLSWQ